MPTRSRREPRSLDTSGSRTEPTAQLTDDQWFLIELLFPTPPPRPRGGRPPHSHRACLEGILFVLVTGCRWKDLPRWLPSKSVCHQRFKLWVETGVFQRVWRRLLELKADLRQLDLGTLLGDATFVSAKKGAIRSGRQSPAKAPSFSC
jgi:transposase